MIIKSEEMTATDISRTMDKLWYDWSNQAQLYIYKKPGKEYSLQPISRELAELICYHLDNRGNVK